MVEFHKEDSPVGFLVWRLEVGEYSVLRGLLRLDLDLRHQRISQLLSIPDLGQLWKYNKDLAYLYIPL